MIYTTNELFDLFFYIEPDAIAYIEPEISEIFVDTQNPLW